MHNYMTIRVKIVLFILFKSQYSFWKRSYRFGGSVKISQPCKYIPLCSSFLNTDNVEWYSTVCYSYQQVFHFLCHSLLHHTQKYQEEVYHLFFHFCLSFVSQAPLPLSSLFGSFLSLYELANDKRR